EAVRIVEQLVWVRSIRVHHPELVGRSSRGKRSEHQLPAVGRPRPTARGTAVVCKGRQLLYITSVGLHSEDVPTVRPQVPTDEGNAAILAREGGSGRHGEAKHHDRHQKHGPQAAQCSSCHNFSSRMVCFSSRNSRWRDGVERELTSESARLPSPRQPEFRRTLSELGTFLSPMNYGSA